MTRNRKQLILSLAFLFGSLGLWSQVTPQFEDPAPAVTCTRPALTCPAQTAAFQVEGVWEQYHVESDGQRTFMARLDIRPDEFGDYSAAPLSLSPSTFPKHEYRSFAHQYTESGMWTFREQWDHEVGEFVLQKIGENEYEGVAFSSNGSQFQTVFVRVK